MTKTVEDFFMYVATYITLLPILLFLYFISRTRKSDIVVLILCSYSSIELITNLIGVYSDSSQLVYQSYSLFTVLEYICFSSLLYFLTKGAKIHKAIIYLALLFTAFAIIYSQLKQTQELDTIPIGVETILILGVSFYYLYEQMEDTSQLFIYNRYGFWIASGLMIYLAGSFFIYVFANQVDNSTLQTYWMFQNFFTILKNLCFCISIALFYRQKETRVERFY